MDCYYGYDINDFHVPKDQDLLDWHPLPESWSNWGINAPEGFDSPKQYFTMDTNATDLEFDFMEESFGNEVELEHSLNDKDQSTSSSFQQTLSSDQCNYELQGLLCLEQTGGIFLDSVIDDLSCVEDQHNSFYFCPENPCSNRSRGLQKDTEASKFVPNNLNSKDCLNIEQCNRDEAMHEQYSNEESILQNLEIAIAQFTGKTRICFRDAFYRLARDTKHVVENLDDDLNMQTTVLGEVTNETMRCEDNETMESDTNSVDRAVANLMFNKMDTNI